MRDLSFCSTDDSLSLDLAVKQDFMDKMFSLTLQARNILSTARWQSTTQSEGYYAFSTTKREAPVVMLNFRYTLNNYKDRNRDSNNGDDFNDNSGG